MKKVKGENEKGGLKLNISKTKIMASGVITSWQIDGETMETVHDFTFLGSKITVNIDCSHKPTAMFCSKTTSSKTPSQMPPVRRNFS